MSNQEDENHIVAEIVSEILSGNDYDPKSIPKRYLPKVQAVLIAAKQDAIARGQLQAVKQLQAILALLPETSINNNGFTNSLLDRRNIKRTVQPTSKLTEKRTPRYMPKKSRSKYDSQLPSSRFNRPKSVLQNNNRNKNNNQISNGNNKNLRPNSELNTGRKEYDDFTSIDFEPDADIEKANRAINSSPPTAKYRIQNKSKKRVYTDEQLDVALESMVNGNSFIPKTDVLPELIDYSKRKIDSLIENGELIAAQKYEDVYQQLQSSRLTWEECNAKTVRLNELTIQMNKADRSLQIAEENMQNELDEYDERMDIIRQAQLKEFEKQIYKFDKETNFRIMEKYDDEYSQNKSNLSTSRSSVNQSKDLENTKNSINSGDQLNSENSNESENSIDYTNSQNLNKTISSTKSTSKSKIYPNLPPSFRKFSQRLLDLREREKLLLKTRRFEEAGYTRIEADKLEAIEIEQCKLNYLKSREDKRAKLIEEQNQKIKCFDQNGARVRQRLQTENESRISALKRAKENFQVRIDRLDVDIKDTLSLTSAPSPLQSRPMSPPRSPDSNSPPTFMTQQQQQQLIQRHQKNQQKNEDDQIEEKKKSTKKRTVTTMASPQIVYRPIPSKWRLQTPQILKMHK